MDDDAPVLGSGIDPGSGPGAGDDDGLEPGEEDLDPREEARIHRRDHDADAHRRELLRPGMAKVFKQLGDLPPERQLQRPKPKPHKRGKA